MVFTTNLQCSICPLKLVHRAFWVNIEGWRLLLTARAWSTTTTTTTTLTTHTNKNTTSHKHNLRLQYYVPYPNIRSRQPDCHSGQTAWSHPSPLGSKEHQEAGEGHRAGRSCRFIAWRFINRISLQATQLRRRLPHPSPLQQLSSNWMWVIFVVPVCCREGSLEEAGETRGNEMLQN